jgi:hypothetical protein
VGPGQATQGKSWAKVRLTRGQSAGGVWEIDQQYPQARLAIGSDPNAGWAVQGPGVRPMHFELYWDGRCLFVADTQRVGGVALNGAPLGPEWTQVRGRGEVVFGQAAMAIETSEAQAIALPDPASARRINAGEGPSGQHNVAELTGEATRMTDSPLFDAPSLTGEATRIQDSPLDAPAAPPKIGIGGAPPPPQRPRLGGPNDPPVNAQAKTLMQDELVGAVGEATRMVAMPDVPPSIVIAPGMGGPPPPPMMPMGGPPQGGSPFGSPSPPSGGFAAPPGFGEVGPPPMVKQPMKLPLGLTPRTAGMVGALTLAIVVLAFVGLGDDEEEYVDDSTQIAQPPPTTIAAPPPTIQPLPTTALGVPPTIMPLPPPTGYAPPTYVPPTYVPPTYVPPVTAAPPPTVAPPPTTVVDPAAPLPPTPERLAADQVLAGRYSDALPLYQALAMQHPERPEYSAMVGILEQRIRAAQCVNGIGPDGRPCAR